LVYCLGVIGIPKASLLLIPLLVLGLLVLPIVPETEIASVKLRTAEVENTGTLLGLKGVAVPTGSGQAKLDREGILRLRGSGLPWREGSNTFIVGHALGFPQTKVPYAFYQLRELVPGDKIFFEVADGRRYTFRMYDRLTVKPDDFWVTYPVEGKTTVSLQTCTPIPTFENRLIVRGELVS
jgi:sortase A